MSEALGQQALDRPLEGSSHNEGIETEEFVSFWVDGQLLGIPVSMVQEVLASQRITPVPLAPREVAGLLNLRGQIVMGIDLRRRLDLGERPADQRPMNVVVRTDDGPASLLVDEIGDVVEVDRNTFESPPATLKGPAREFTRGAYKLEDRLLIVLNIKKVLHLEAREG